MSRATTKGRSGEVAGVNGTTLPNHRNHHHCQLCWKHSCRDDGRHYFCDHQRRHHCRYVLSLLLLSLSASLPPVSLALPFFLLLLITPSRPYLIFLTNIIVSQPSNPTYTAFTSVAMAFGGRMGYSTRNGISRNHC